MVARNNQWGDYSCAVGCRVTRLAGRGGVGSLRCALDDDRRSSLGGRLVGCLGTGHRAVAAHCGVGNAGHFDGNHPVRTCVCGGGPVV